MDKGVLKNIGCSVVDGNEESLLEALERAHRLGMKSALCMVLSRVFSDDVYESGIENPESVYIEKHQPHGPDHRPVHRRLQR